MATDVPVSLGCFSSEPRKWPRIRRYVLLRLRAPGARPEARLRGRHRAVARERSLGRSRGSHGRHDPQGAARPGRRRVRGRARRGRPVRSRRLWPRAHPPVRLRRQGVGHGGARVDRRRRRRPSCPDARVHAGALLPTHARTRGRRASSHPRDVLRKVLWRSLPALEILVREELVPTWKAEGRSSKWCKRILRLLKEEMLPVPRSWVADAPADLVAALPKVVDAL